MNCKINCKRLAMSVVAVFAFIFVSDFIIHGQLLSGIYKETAALWRPESEMQSYMPWMIFAQLLMGTFLCLIFTYGQENKGIGEGVRYGLYIGAFSAAHSFVWYAVAPIPQTLLWGWVGSCLVQSMISGVIVSLIYKKA